MTPTVSTDQFVRSFAIDHTSGCWNWTAAVNKGGYGQFQHARAHRVVWESLVEPIPNGYVLDHLCCNPGCVNPDHLEPVTQRENVLRGKSPTAQNALKTHCPKGHPYDEANTYVIAQPGRIHRMCRTCGRANTARYVARKRENAE